MKPAYALQLIRRPSAMNRVSSSSTARSNRREILAGTRGGL